MKWLQLLIEQQQSAFLRMWSKEMNHGERVHRSFVKSLR
ncbi:hypothetical protein SD77_2037 [Bacillus badius]|uniref:Mobile element protein n=1 Tax=Bacillus badius TaxID=1455 RepID=A0ABR5AXV7_BACBA|nr:hypothetical protein SD77_2037 [Bacillus badius]